MSEQFAAGLSERDAVECVAAYLETALRALDSGDLDVARAALRRMAQYLLVIERVDAVNGGGADDGGLA